MIFDCDGTLIDTIKDVALCFNKALRTCGFAERPVEDYGGYVGGNLETVVGRLLSEQDRCSENVDRVKTVYRELYSASPKEYTIPYPGIVEALEALREAGFVLAVNTNKGQKLTDELLEKLSLTDMFAAVVGYEESRPSKPDPHGVDLICQMCAMTREQAVYIGDGRSDIETAANAGIPCVFVTWGQGTEEDRNDPRIVHVVESVAQMQDVFMKGIC